MEFDGLGGDEECLGDGPVGAAGRRQVGDASFAEGERLGPAESVTARAESGRAEFDRDVAGEACGAADLGEIERSAKTAWASLRRPARRSAAPWAARERACSRRAGLSWRICTDSASNTSPSGPPRTRPRARRARPRAAGAPRIRRWPILRGPARRRGSGRRWRTWQGLLQFATNRGRGCRTRSRPRCVRRRVRSPPRRRDGLAAGGVGRPPRGRSSGGRCRPGRKPALRPTPVRLLRDHRYRGGPGRGSRLRIWGRGRPGR